MEKEITLTACSECGKGYPYRELTEGLCKWCLSFKKIKNVRRMIVKKHKKEIKDGIDVTGKLKCPYCDGYISYGIASSVNGHIHAFCENDCVGWME